MNKDRIFTYHTRLTLAPVQEGVLNRYAILYGKAERSLFAAIQSGKDPVRLKASFIKTFGITARQFNAIRMHLQGKIASVKALQSVHAEQLRTKIVKAKKVIKRLQEKAPGSDKLHQKERTSLYTRTQA